MDRYSNVYNRILTMRANLGIKVDEKNFMELKEVKKQKPKKNKSSPVTSYEDKVLSSVKYSKQLSEKEKRTDKLFEEYNNRLKNGDKVSIIGLCKEFKLSVPNVVSIFQKSGMLTNHKHIIYSYKK